MVMRVPKPHQRSEEDLSWQSLGNTPDHFTEQKTVSPHGQMVAMLFNRSDRKDHRHVPIKSLDLFPAEFNKIHGGVKIDIGLFN
jgi:hypothetical protein